MTVIEFLSQYGELKDANVHFVKAGNTVVKPVSDLLEEFASAQPIVAGPDAKIALPKKRNVKKK